MSKKQRTLAQKVTLTGKGLHTGLEVTMTITPAKEGHGIAFQRVDLENNPIIPALATYVIDTSRGTVLEKDGARVGTIEHCLAALFGCDIDNALIELNAPEAPIMDGSAKLYVEALKEVGSVEQDAPREYLEITEKVVYTDAENGVELIVLPDTEFSVNAMIAFNESTVLNNQFAVMNSMDDFEKEIAPCRTFVFLRELELLLNHNLVKGGDLDNAIVIMDRKVNQEELDRIADLFNHNRVEVKESGILNNIDLFFDNEPARHKILDIIGDLALVGKRIKGRVIAVRPGHNVNTQLAKKLIKKFNKDSAPVYDPNSPSVLDVNKIMTLLPHRSPFLLVDKVIDIKDSTIIGVKNVTMNEPFFVGHFPEEPVMPGVLIVEAMAQTGGLLILNGLEDAGGYSTYFMKIDNIKFRKKVVPGDTLLFKLELLSPIRRGVANMRGKAYIGKNMVAEGEFMAQIVKNK